jgi:hypothetical protein
MAGGGDDQHHLKLSVREANAKSAMMSESTATMSAKHVSPGLAPPRSRQLGHGSRIVD